jgi:hypothetical protein
MGKVEWSIREPVIEPEGSRGAITNINIGERTIGGELIIDNFPKVTIHSGHRSIKGTSISQNPIFPRSLRTGVSINFIRIQRFCSSRSLTPNPP